MNYSGNTFKNNDISNPTKDKILDATPYLATAIVLGSIALNKNKGVNLKNVVKEGLMAVPRTLSKEVAKNNKAFKLTVDSLKNAFKRYGVENKPVRQDPLSPENLDKAMKNLKKWKESGKAPIDEFNEPLDLPNKPAKSMWKSIGQAGLYGATPVATSLVLSNLADDYFKKRDKEEIRQKLRTLNPYIPSDTPDMKIRAMQERLNKNAASDAGTWGEALKKDFGGSFRRSLLLSTVPAVVGTAINKNIKDNFKPIVDKNNKGNADEITIDVPLETLDDIKKMNKKAWVSPKEVFMKAKLPKAKAMDYAKDIASKVKEFPKKMTKENAKEIFKNIKEKGPEVAKSEAFNIGKDVLSTAGWVLPPAIVTTVTGRNLAKGDLRKLEDVEKQDRPIAPGTARITIQTKKKDDNLNHQYDMMMGGK